MAAKIILFATLATVATALSPARNLAPRQTGASDDIPDSDASDSGLPDLDIPGIPSGCMDAMTVLGSIPTPPAEIVSYQVTASVTDPCNFQPPASLASEYSSYQAEVSQWYAEHSSDVEAIQSQCATLLEGADVPICSPTATVSSGAAHSSGVASNSSGASSSDKPSGAQHNGALAGAAVAIVGLIGAAFVL